jgi:hypothetical protein
MFLSALELASSESIFYYNLKLYRKSHFTFVDFFPIEEMADEHLGLNVITMKEYLETRGECWYQYSLLHIHANNPVSLSPYTTVVADMQHSRGI